MSSLHTMMTNDYHYTDHISVRRLSPAELANPQLRVDNRNLKMALEYQSLPSRPQNKHIITERTTEYLTDYPNEAPIVREHNNAHMGGGSFAGGAIKNAGPDPNHPRLSRDPSWYEGRGKDRAKEFGNSVLKGVEMAAEIVPEIL